MYGQIDVIREEVVVLLVKANKNVVYSLLYLQNTGDIKRTTCCDIHDA